MWDDNISHSGWGFKKMFEQIPFSKLNIAKADVSDPLRGPRDEPDDDKVSPKLRAMVAAMVKADPTKSEEEHLYHLLPTAHGRRLAEHLNNLSKGETKMPTVDIMKLHNPDSVIEFIKSSGASEHVISEVIMGHAKLNKRDGESDAQAFARVFPKFQTAYGVAKGYPNLMSIEPVSIEVGDTSVADDSWKASAQLAALVEETRALAPTLTSEQLFV